MLQLIPNKEKTAIQFVFIDFFTHENQFVTAFDLEDAKSIALDLLEKVKEIQRRNDNGHE